MCPGDLASPLSFSGAALQGGHDAGNGTPFLSFRFMAWSWPLGHLFRSARVPGKGLLHSGSHPLYNHSLAAQVLSSCCMPSQCTLQTCPGPISGPPRVTQGPFHWSRYTNMDLVGETPPAPPTLWQKPGLGSNVAEETSVTSWAPAAGLGSRGQDFVSWGVDLLRTSEVLKFRFHHESHF